MKNRIFIGLFVLFPSWLFATFSIVAVDSITGEVGSAGATCGDSLIWPGTSGAKIISDVLPGIGAIHTQAYYREVNKRNARLRMEAGDSPQEIIQWLETNDEQNNPALRQYGVVAYNSGHPQTAGYTGVNTDDYKGHLVGPNYAIQGNILLGKSVLDSIEARFINDPGFLSDKLMSALQGANLAGADTRCLSEGTSSLSAFVRVARKADEAGNLYLDLNVGATPQGVEPIDVLQTKFEEWKTSLVFKRLSNRKSSPMLVQKGNVLFFKLDPNVRHHIEIGNFSGEVLWESKVNSGVSLNFSKYPEFANRVLWVTVRNEIGVNQRQLIVVP